MKVVSVIAAEPLACAPPPVVVAVFEKKREATTVNGEPLDTAPPVDVDVFPSNVDEKIRVKLPLVSFMSAPPCAALLL
jgi:hypothetical protein